MKNKKVLWPLAGSRRLKSYPEGRLSARVCNINLCLENSWDDVMQVWSPWGDLRNVLEKTDRRTRRCCLLSESVIFELPPPSSSSSSPLISSELLHLFCYSAWFSLFIYLFIFINRPNWEVSHPKSNLLLPSNGEEWNCSFTNQIGMMNQCSDY